MTHSVTGTNYVCPICGALRTFRKAAAVYDGSKSLMRRIRSGSRVNIKNGYLSVDFVVGYTSLDFLYPVTPVDIGLCCHRSNVPSEEKYCVPVFLKRGSSLCHRITGFFCWGGDIRAPCANETGRACGAVTEASCFNRFVAFR
ncbi:hypothetical protein TNIN_372891 [Trichonephila inaurata madagascariensis]|uniref:Uncharacterized protein n=1 Tax=Trichonephila inaurata madagascariensis TaxID=2747483 RepID=A0A8X6YHT1_9ARAC|nr:hypothetical protein TNIN_372891 [Trichonephila inaurata madagascariensis]